MTPVVVGAALVHNGRLLAAQRTSPPELAGLWEFPGGKVEPGETEQAALVRECLEELGADVEVGSLVGEVEVPVGTLRVYRATLRSGGVENREHGALRWLAAAELFDVEWIPVDLALVRLLAGETRHAAGRNWSITDVTGIIWDMAADTSGSFDAAPRGSEAGSHGSSDEFLSEVPETLGTALDSLVPESVTDSAFSPTPPGVEVPHRHWWGRHISEFRWTAEAAVLTMDPVFYGLGVPHGNGQPVLLIPGFLAADASLSVMAGWLFRLGYRPRRSGISLANVDCSDRAVDRLEKRLENIVRSTGRRAAIVGHSRGGHFAKALGSRRPDLVGRVVTMGSGLDTPFDISVPTKAMVSGVRTVLHRVSSQAREKGCFTSTCDCPFTRDYAAPFPTDQVPLTSIYSWGDGVVWPPACIADYATNVRVPGSHVGLAFNRHAYRAIARALAPKSED